MSRVSTIYTLLLATLALVQVQVVLGITDPVDVFTAGTNGVADFRIPSLVATGKGTLIAFAEARLQSSSDCKSKYIAARRSVDNGTTWGPLVPVFGNKLPTDETAGNPTVVFDVQTGRIVVLFMIGDAKHCNPGLSIMILDDDGSDGITWSTPRNISASLGAYAGALPGPGTAAQLPLSSAWPGRIIFPAHLGAYVSDAVAYSDDGGDSWSLSETVFPKMDESVIAALPNGSLILNMRNNRLSACKCRAISRSEDGGKTWTPITFDATLIEPVCQASLVEIGNSLYFSNPASTTGRANITVRKSNDGGASWQNPGFLVNAPVSDGYTCMASGWAIVDPSSGVNDLYGGILYESSTNAVATIAFRTFPL